VSAYRRAVMEKDGDGLSKLPGETAARLRLAFVDLRAFGVNLHDRQFARRGDRCRQFGAGRHIYRRGEEKGGR
jgi:hypothetical protein